MMSGFVEKLGTNFIIATFIPSLGFFIIAFFILDPILPFDVAAQITIATEAPLFGVSLILFVFSLLLGFTLLGLNSFIYKMTEGYFILPRLSFLRQRQIKKAFHQRRQIILAEKLLRHLKGKKNAATDPKIIGAIASLRQKNTQLKASYRLNYPQYAANILPTRFGNIFRTAESYPNEQYGIDGVVMWPRLLFVIAPSYISRLEQSNNGLAFIINSMILSFVLVILCLFASASQFYILHITKENFEIQRNEYFREEGKWPEENDVDERYDTFEVIKPLYFLEIEVVPEAQQRYSELRWLYISGAMFFLLTSIVFYNAALPAARTYGGLIRSAYDLFRFDLAKQLKLPQAKDWNDEKENWSIWSEFVLLGRQKDLKAFTYRYDEEPFSQE